jgi:23S rRNA (pseudouridine1915-N3)-methyltransferase
VIRAIWAGASKDRLLADAAARYAHRISRRTPFRLEDLGAGRGTRPGQVKAAEAKKFLSRIPADGHLVTLDSGGRSMGSRVFADWLQGMMSRAGGDLFFVVGGHEGLDGPVLERANSCISLSAMTFTHEMARVLLLEQIYRALTILRGEPYHH